MSSSNSDSAPSGGKQRVLVNVILDKSGSMSSKVQDVIGGFNLYLDEIAKEPAVDYGFSLTLFDTVVEMKYKGVPLATVAKIDEKTYRPGGCTALLDAVGDTVQAVGTDNFDKVITVIMTDGEENSSREWTLKTVRELEEHECVFVRRSQGSSWVFQGRSRRHQEVLEVWPSVINSGLPIASVGRRLNVD